jgi:hypothetical protein
VPSSRVLTHEQFFCKHGVSLELKVIHLPLNVGNNVYPLSLALRRRGIQSDCLVLEPHPFGYPYDFTLSTTGKVGKLKVELARIFWLLRILRSYNTIHFNYGSTLAGRFPANYRQSLSKRIARFPYAIYLNLFQLVELKLYKLFRKKMFIHYQGDDARQTHIMKGLHYSLLQGAKKGTYSIKTDKFKSAQIKRITNFTEKVYHVNPDLSALLPPHSEFLPYSHIDVSKYNYQPQSQNRECIRIVHAPSNRGAKGTEFVLRALEQVKSTNPRVKIEIVENLSHEAALRKYKQADLVIDQLLAGWYGGLAVEALAFGVPVMCYLREEDYSNLDKEMIRELPIINVSLQNLEQKILDFIALSDADKEDIRRRSRSYIEKWHNVDTICNRLIVDYFSAHETN